MKRVRCPKCDQYVTFDETRYEDGQSLVFQCIHCGRQFGIRMGVSKLKKIQREDKEPEIDDSDCSCGAIVVIENVFHFKQVIPLRMGENIIGRYQRDSRVNCPIETVDPSVDLGRPRASRHRPRHAFHYRGHEHLVAWKRRFSGLNYPKFS